MLLYLNADIFDCLVVCCEKSSFSFRRQAKPVARFQIYAFAVYDRFASPFENGIYFFVLPVEVYERHAGAGRQSVYAYFRARKSELVVSSVLPLSVKLIF